MFRMHIATVALAATLLAFSEPASAQLFVGIDPPNGLTAPHPSAPAARQAFLDALGNAVLLPNWAQSAQARGGTIYVNDQECDQCQDTFLWGSVVWGKILTPGTINADASYGPILGVVEDAVMTNNNYGARIKFDTPLYAYGVNFSFQTLFWSTGDFPPYNQAWLATYRNGVELARFTFPGIDATVDNQIRAHVPVFVGLISQLEPFDEVEFHNRANDLMVISKPIVASVPEPSVLALVLVGLLAVFGRPIAAITRHAFSARRSSAA